MRYIDISQLELPDSWLAKAQELRERLEGAKDKAERDEIVEKNPIWQELVVPLAHLSKGKCWYSEAKELMSDRDVDHFRPKSEARGLPKKMGFDVDSKKREGYWWLAYDWENYRFSSIYCNRRRLDKFKAVVRTGGKWSYFPLFNDSYVATTKERLSDEDVVLLDPTNEHDPPLVSFDSNGDLIPNSSNPQEITRVKVSEMIYHLDHTPLKEERIKIWNKCKRHIDEIDRIKSQKTLSITDKARLIFIKNELKAMTSMDEELSAVAIACCEHYRLNYLTRS